VDRVFLTPKQPTSLLYSDINLDRALSATIAAGSITYNSSKTNYYTNKTPKLYAETLSLDEAKTKVSEWQSLILRSLEPNIFHEPRFIFAATHLLSARKQPFFIFIWQNNIDTNTPPYLVGVFPFQVSYLNIAAPILRCWQNVNTALATPIVDATQADHVIAALFDHVANTRYKSILFPKLVGTGLFSQALKRVLSERQSQLSLVSQTSRAILSCTNNGQSYIQSNWRNKKLKELQRQRRRLSEIAPISSKIIDTLPEISQAIKRFLTLESSGWKGKNGTALTQKTMQYSFATNMMQSFTIDNKIEIHELYCGEKLIASGILLKAINMSYFWKITHDETFAKFSPGVLLTQDLTKHCINQPNPIDVDSCAIANHPMINSLWVDKKSIIDALVSTTSQNQISFQFSYIREKIKQKTYQGLRALYIKLKRAKNN
jgi:Acetyltransferase (GNAT) domain